MKNLIAFLILLSFSTTAGAQLISSFTWENNPVITAAHGSNAISVSSYATVTTGGTNSTKGLSPGGQYDINLVLDGARFNVPAIDISIDFRREESVASFFYRGAFFNFGMNNGSLNASFSLTSGNTFITINSGNIYNISDDHIFHNYHFIYDNNTGIAKVLVDAVTVYTYNGTAGVALYWTGAGNITIGKDMDATGKNVAVLDNLVIQKYASALLPLRLLSFSAEEKNSYAEINWNTTEEINVTSFVVEKSSSGAAFSAVKTIAAVNGYQTTNHYQYTDSLPFSPVTYYRIKILNRDGSFTYSAISSVTLSTVKKAAVTVYPNPTADYIIVKMNDAAAGKYLYTVTAVSGQQVISSAVQLNSGAQQIRIDLTKTAVKGVMVVKMSNANTGMSETFTIVKS